MVKKIDDIMLECYGMMGEKEKKYSKKYISGTYKLKNRVLDLSAYYKIYINFIELLNLEEYYLEAYRKFLLEAIHKLEDSNESIKKYGFSVYKKIKDSKLTFKKILRKVFIFINISYDIAQEYVAGLLVSQLAKIDNNQSIDIVIEMVLPSIIIKYFNKIFSGILTTINIVFKNKYNKSILSEMNTVVYDLKRLSEEDSDGVLYFDLHYELKKDYYPESFRMLLSELSLTHIEDNSTLYVNDQKELGVTFYESGGE